MEVVQISKEELKQIIEEVVRKEIENLKNEFELWFETYQKILDSLIPEEEPDEEEIN